MSSTTIALISLLAALLGPLVTYAYNARKLSGKIGTSEAEDLWTESRAIRDHLEERNTMLRDRLDKCETDIQELRARNVKLWLENGTLRKMVESHEKTIEVLREDIESLRRENRRLEAENRSLRKRVKELEEHDGTPA